MCVCESVCVYVCVFSSYLNDKEERHPLIIGNIDFSASKFGFAERIESRAAELQTKEQGNAMPVETSCLQLEVQHNRIDNSDSYFLYGISDGLPVVAFDSEMESVHRKSVHYGFPKLSCYFMNFHPQKQPYSSFENNTGRTDRHDLLQRGVVASKSQVKNSTH